MQEISTGVTFQEGKKCWKRSAYIRHHRGGWPVIWEQCSKRRLTKQARRTYGRREAESWRAL